MLRRFAALALLSGLTLILLLGSAPLPEEHPTLTLSLPRNSLGGGAAVVDTVAGYRIPCEGARRIVFYIYATSMRAPCSLAVIQVSNKDSVKTRGGDEGPRYGWTDANGLAGGTIIDNVSSAWLTDTIASGVSLGGMRTIELAAPGSGRLAWHWARVVLQPKYGINGEAITLTIRPVVFFD